MANTELGDWSMADDLAATESSFVDRLMVFDDHFAGARGLVQWHPEMERDHTLIGLAKEGEGPAEVVNLSMANGNVEMSRERDGEPVDLAQAARMLGVAAYEVKALHVSFAAAARASQEWARPSEESAAPDEAIRALAATAFGVPATAVTAPATSTAQSPARVARLSEVSAVKDVERG